MPIASILIPVYNREALIEKTLNCALAQTVADIEIIVVDNCSTDRTFEVCQSYAARDPRISVYRNETNVGPVRNWIKCVEYAKAPFAKILFSDDLIAPTFLEKTLPFLMSKDCGFVYSQVIVGEEEWRGELHYRNFLSDTKIVRETFLRVAVRLGGFFAPVSPGAALFRTDDLRKNIKTELDGIPVTEYDFAATGAGVDWLIYGLTALQYPHVAYVAEPLVYFRQHPGSISINNEGGLVPTGYSLVQKWFMARVTGL